MPEHHIRTSAPPTEHRQARVFALLILMLQDTLGSLFGKFTLVATLNQNPEQIARDQIDQRLSAAGFTAQAMKSVDHTTGTGIAICEYQTSVGPADYALFSEKVPLAIVEAKPDSWGAKVTTVEAQSRQLRLRSDASQQ